MFSAFDRLVVDPNSLCDHAGGGFKQAFDNFASILRLPKHGRGLEFTAIKV